jgi:uncharacterized caspase-like protein
MYRKQALCIGIKNYSPSRLALEPCLNDARDMTTALRSIGFQAQYVGDPDLQLVASSTAKFVNSIKPGAVVVYYFSGHGAQYNGNNYVIPRDALGLYAGNIESRALEVEFVIDAMLKRAPRVVICILDACRTEPPTEPIDGYSRDRTFAGLKAGLAPMQAPPATIVVYASAANAPASARSPNNRNSLYTAYLLKYITTPNIDIDYLLKRTAIDVQNDSENGQIPYRYSSCNEPIYLAGYGGYKAVMPPQHIPKRPVVHSSYRHHGKQVSTHHAQPWLHNFHHHPNDRHAMPMNYHLMARNPPSNIMQVPLGYYPPFPRHLRHHRR